MFVGLQRGTYGPKDSNGGQILFWRVDRNVLEDASPASVYLVGLYPSPERRHELAQ